MRTSTRRRRLGAGRRLVFSIADKQRSAGEALAEDTFVPYIGTQDQVTHATLREVVLSLVWDVAGRRALSRASRGLVEGDGAARDIEAIWHRSDAHG